jgi:uncharacterized damage-inducible protein DinB
VAMLPEVQNYLERLDDLFAQVGTLVAGLSAEALNWRPIEGQDEHATNSLAVLATHIAGADRFWIGEVVGGRPPRRIRAEEFEARADDAVGLMRLLDEAAAENREVLAALDDAALEGVRQARGRTVPVRWCILQIIDHTALHLGHMQLTYQLWQGGTAGPSPLWYERLKATE